jgi:2-hydroxy-6-oxonona-2,4-dienedioate hydrolase
MKLRFAALLALCLLLGATLAWQRYRTALDSVEQRLLSGSQVADTACGPIEFAVRGSGPPVLAVHGAGGGYTQLSELNDALIDAGFTVVAMSRFGYLRTPMPADASPQAQADAHACLLDHLGIRQAAVLGVSAGAPSTMQLCLRHRERCAAMLLLVPVAFAEGRAPDATTPTSPFMRFVLERVLTSDFIMWTMTRLAPRMLIETALATPLTVLDAAAADEQARALRIVHDIFPVGPKLEGLANDSAIAPAVPRYALEDIMAPTLVISVEDDLYDTWAGARYSARHIPRARFVGYPTGGHVWLGHHAEVTSELRQFLRGQTAW